MSMPDVQQGYVKWFDNKKGFGFIRTELGEDIFVHYSNIEGEGRRELKQNQRVSYQLLQSKRGFQALHVRIENV